MHEKTISRLRGAVAQEKIKVLEDIFAHSTGHPPGVQADRYRADHPQSMELLDTLDTSQLFLRRQQQNAARYEVTVFALPMLHDDRARELLACMNQLYAQMRLIYKERLGNPVAVGELVTASRERGASCTDEVAVDALYYMTQSHGVWSGLSNGFPHAAEATIAISESVLRYGDFDALLEEFYDWHILNPHDRAAAASVAESALPSADAHSISFKSEQSKHPLWYEQLDDLKKALISEIETALSSELAALPMMGLRALFETIMADQIGTRRTFKESLGAFTTGGYITQQHAAVIGYLVDAGHAAVHRAYFPNRSDLETCVEAVKHLMHGVYILKPRMDALHANIPTRPPLDKKP